VLSFKKKKKKDDKLGKKLIGVRADAIQRDLGRLEERADRRHGKCSRDKCRVAPQGRKSPWQGCRLGADGLGSSSAEKALGVSADREQGAGELAVCPSSHKGR